MPKYIIVTGGVISGVGKGVSTASLGKILQAYGFKVTAIKIDPYINCDAGTLRPTEHGEVWVTDDGGEIDQDLGNYERFLGHDIPKMNNITTGQIYKTVIDRERKGEYLGKTVQFIPHITDEIKRRIVEAGKGYDFVLVEIGGTVGDYENVPFLFASKNLERDFGKGEVLHFLVTYMVVPRHVQEMKTKPTQQAIKALIESSGILPDFIICRTPLPLDDVRRKKIETYANIESDHVISSSDVKTIYQVPLDFTAEKVGQKIMKELGVKPKQNPNWTRWRNLVKKIIKPKAEVKIAIVGKYLDIGDFELADSYISISQALVHAGANLNVGVRVEWVDSKKLEKSNKEIQKLKQFAGVIIPGGFGGSGVEGKIKAIQFARENSIPFLGLCYGMQLALVEFARNICKMKNANTTEINKKTPYSVIDILPTQKKLMAESKYGGTMRLGAYAAVLEEGSQVFGLYKRASRLLRDKSRIAVLQKLKDQKFRLGKLQRNKDKHIVLERHRHRYEVSPKYIKKFESNGIKFSGYHTRLDGTKLMEFMELPNHKFFIATQGHPEFKSRLEDPAPLFWGFVKACLK